MKRRKRRSTVKNILALFMGVLFSLLLLGLLEWVCVLDRSRHFLPDFEYGKQRQRYPYTARETRHKLDGIDATFIDALDEKASPELLFDEDDYLDRTLPRYPKRFFHDEIRPRPNQQVRSMARGAKSRKVVFDVDVTIDAYRRRIVPKANPGPAQEFIAFLGCSYTFGEGVSDDETLPARVQQQLPEHNVYNLGLFSYGPNDILDDFRDPDSAVLKGIEEEQGITIYYYMSNHYHRLFGTMDCFRLDQWKMGMPGLPKEGANKSYYRLNRDGSLAREGTFLSERHLTTYLYGTLAKSALLEYLNISLPFIRDSHCRLFSAVIEEIKALAEQRLGSRRFVFVIHPGHAIFDDRVISYLEEAGITVFDYSRFDADGLLKGYFKIPLDGHPTPTFHRFLSLLIVRDLRREGILK